MTVTIIIEGIKGKDAKHVLVSEKVTNKKQAEDIASDLYGNKVKSVEIS